MKRKSAGVWLLVIGAILAAVFTVTLNFVCDGDSFCEFTKSEEVTND